MVAGMEAVGMTVRRSKITQWVCDRVFRGHRNDVNANCAVSRETTSPSMLPELGFIGNQDDNHILNTFLDALVKAIADVSCEFQGMAWEESASSPEPETG